jgi:hypothetical protein
MLSNKGIKMSNETPIQTVKADELKREKYDRVVMIETDGVNIHIGKCDLTVLELCEACRRVLHAFTEFEGGK